MASVFLYHVVGDLTVGKPEMMEFVETETVEAAIRAIGDSTEGGITVWKKRSVHYSLAENSEIRQQRFVGILNSLDIVSFLAKDWCLKNQEMALKTPVSEVVVHNYSLLKELDPATRLIDALELMKQGVRRLLVPKSVGWKGMSKRFSILYNGRWLKNFDTSNGDTTNAILNANKPSSSYASANRDRFCCLSREDVIRFLIDCLGALAPLPLSSISSLGTINPNYCSIEASMPAINVTFQPPDDPTAVAIVEPAPDGQYRIIGEISASKLWKCDYIAAAWALANLTAGQFVMGVEDSMTSRNPPNFSVSDMNGDTLVSGGARRAKKFSSKSIGFQNNPTSLSLGIRSMYRGRSAPLTCKVSNSLAAVMAQLLSHRASHVWVTEDDNEDVLVGIVGYADILATVTKISTAAIPSTESYECFGTDQNGVM